MTLNNNKSRMIFCLTAPLSPLASYTCRLSYCTRSLNQYELGAVYLQFLSDDSLYVSHCRIVILGYDESSFIYLSLSLSDYSLPIYTHKLWKYFLAHWLIAIISSISIRVKYIY